MKKISVLFAALLCLGLAESVARADASGYVCDVTQYKYQGSPVNAGNYGYIDVSIYSGPHCTGSVVGTHYYCSVGATWTACAADTTKLLSETELLALRRDLLDSGRWGNYVISYATPCVNTSYTNLCGGIARFFQYANK